MPGVFHEMNALKSADRDSRVAIVLQEGRAGVLVNTTSEATWDVLVPGIEFRL